MKTTEPKSISATTSSARVQGPTSMFGTETAAPFFSEAGQSTKSLFAPPASLSPFFSSTGVQAKLTVRQPSDKYEQEADAMADRVVQRKCAKCAAEEEGIAPKLQRKPIFESQAEDKVQRKCAACAAAERISPLPVQRSGEGEVSASADLESRLNATRGGGAPLPKDSRTQMESSFGTDFGGVRVHTDSGAVRMNRELGAQAFTHGANIYFNRGKYDPGSSGGRHLLAHELTHVVQQGGSIQRSAPELQRSPEDWVAYSTAEPVSEAQIFQQLLTIEFFQPMIDNLIMDSLTIRSQMKNQCSPSLLEGLHQKRNDLIPLLEQQVKWTRSAITSIYNYLANKMTSNLNDAEYRERMEALALKGDEQKAYLNRLKRWKIRQRVEEINTILQTQSNPGLEFERKELVTFLLSTATEYKQFAQPWGSKRYGNESKCTTIGEAGCGPSSLAIILDLLYQEDPEVQRTVTPAETADYAEDFGRYCNSGTAGDPMMFNVDQEWANFDGIRLSGLSDAEQKLRGGHLIMFLCKNCKGKTESGRTSKYGGHYMVLNGVSDDGKTFDVLDPGRNDTRDIHTISRSELEKHTKGFWMVVKLTP